MILGTENINICPICGGELFHDDSFDHEFGVEKVIRNCCDNCDYDGADEDADNLEIVFENDTFMIFEGRFNYFIVREGEIEKTFPRY